MISNEKWTENHLIFYRKVLVFIFIRIWKVKISHKNETFSPESNFFFYIYLVTVHFSAYVFADIPEIETTWEITRQTDHKILKNRIAIIMNLGILLKNIMC